MVIGSRWARRLAVAAVIPVLLASCGGGGGGGPAVSAEAYASGFCGLLADWIGAIADRSTELSGSIATVASPTDGQELLAAYVDGLIADTEELLTGTEQLGVPDVDGGEAIAETLIAAFEDAKAVLEDARAEVDGLPTDDPAAFAEATGVLGTSIQTSLGGIGTSLGLSNVGSPELDAAFAEDPACTGIGF
ncbi:MAG: hypothetical protein ACT4PO_13320 [Actinomycetota bacterium]